MASDALPTAPLLRTLRTGMSVNGQAVQGALVDFSVSNDNYFSADTWKARISLSGLPSAFGAQFWLAEPSVEVQFSAGLVAGAALSIVTGGYVDEVTLDLDKQEMGISGRDYTAPLIDNLSNDKLTNQTSSQIATLFAQRRGLTPQVTATSTPVGRFLNGQTDYMAEDVSEWRILSFLAQEEGFDVYAKGKTLVFAPSVVDPSPIALNYSPQGAPDAVVRANAPEIRFTHKKVLAGTVTVQVRSWQHQTKSPIISTLTSTKKSATSGKRGTPAVPTSKLSRTARQSGQHADGPFYIIRRSGLTQAQADQLAQKTLADITSHERQVDYSGPGIIGIDARRTLRLTGTGTAADQDYPIKSIERHFGWDKGCSMTITGKSGSPAEAVKL